MFWEAGAFSKLWIKGTSRWDRTSFSAINGICSSTGGRLALSVSVVFRMGKNCSSRMLYFRDASWAFYNQCVRICLETSSFSVGMCICKNGWVFLFLSIRIGMSIKKERKDSQLLKKFSPLRDIRFDKEGKRNIATKLREHGGARSVCVTSSMVDY